MTFETFKVLFLAQLEAAAQEAEADLKITVPRSFEIELYGAGASGERCTTEEAAVLLFISETESYFVIDIAILAVSDNSTKVFVRASGHAPVQYERTWNAQSGMGPLKRIYANIAVIDRK